MFFTNDHNVSLWFFFRCCENKAVYSPKFFEEEIVFTKAIRFQNSASFRGLVVLSIIITFLTKFVKNS